MPEHSPALDFFRTTQMIQLHPFALENERNRFMRPDAYRFLRSDWRCFTGGRQDPLHQLFECAEQKYRPDQPRVPPGSLGGGQWTRYDGNTGQTDPRVISDAADRPTLGSRYAQNRTRETFARVGINGRVVETTPGQQARLTAVEAQARDAIRRVQELDPKWRPTPSAYESVEGLIEAYRGDTRQAEGRFSELQSAGIGPGPFAGGSIPARGPERDFVVMERATINRIGSETGCHTCGTMNPGTPLDNFVLDHQPPTAWNPLGRAQRLYPQCLTCSSKQGNWISRNGGRR